MADKPSSGTYWRTRNNPAIDLTRDRAHRAGLEKKDFENKGKIMGTHLPQRNAQYIYKEMFNFARHQGNVD